MAAPPGVAGAGAVGIGSTPAVLPEMTVAGFADLSETRAAGPVRTWAVATGPAVYAVDASEAAETDTPALQILAQEACQRPATPCQLTHPSAGCHCAA